MGDHGAASHLVQHLRLIRLHAGALARRRIMQASGGGFRYDASVSWCGYRLICVHGRMRILVPHLRHLPKPLIQTLNETALLPPTSLSSPPLTRNIRMPQLQAVIDLDGTLIDSAPDITAAVNKLLTRYGRPAISVEQVRGMVGDGAPILLRRAFAATGAEIDPLASDEIYQTFLDYYDSSPHPRTRSSPACPRRSTSCWLAASSLACAPTSRSGSPPKYWPNSTLPAFSSRLLAATPVRTKTRRRPCLLGDGRSLAPRPTERSWLETTTMTSRRRAAPASR